jgi:hypothetical protein
MPRLTETTFRRLFIATFVVQGIHVFEHVVQLYQVFVLGIPDDRALGLLGYVLQLQGTEEWLHLVFNLSYLSALVVLLVTMRGLVPGSVPRWAFGAFAFAVAFEGWHNVEHAVIISNVIANGGCPCPGIGDVVLGIPDTVLHFFYNAIAFAGTIPAFWLYITRSTRARQAEVELARN